MEIGLGGFLFALEVRNPSLSTSSALLLCKCPVVVPGAIASPSECKAASVVRNEPGLMDYGHSANTSSSNHLRFSVINALTCSVPSAAVASILSTYAAFL